MTGRLLKLILSLVETHIGRMKPAGVIVVFKKEDGSYVSLYHDEERNKTSWMPGTITIDQKGVKE